jgi:uncharacterized lipoprotein YddW (UPF0748 family)
VGVWVHAGMFSGEKSRAIKELNEKLEFYKEIGIEDLYVFQALKKEHRKGWDFLKKLIKVARRNGLQVHPVVTAGHRIRVEGKIKKHPEWLIRDQFGKTRPYLNLSHPGAREHIVKKVRKLLRYEVDGIHLDYIRFPYLKPKISADSPISVLIRLLRFTWGWYIPNHLHNHVMDHYFSYDDQTLREFENHYRQQFSGESLTREHVTQAWVRWNAGNVTLLVREIDETIQKSGKKIPLSAAILSNREFAFFSLGQDWKHWAELGIVDALCPMVYSNNHPWFRERVKGVVQTVKGKSKVYVGIGIQSSTNRNTPGGVKEQIQIAKAEGADGVVFFSGYSLDKEFGAAIRNELKSQIPNSKSQTNSNDSNSKVQNKNEEDESKIPNPKS